MGNQQVSSSFFTWKEEKLQRLGESRRLKWAEMEGISYGDNDIVYSHMKDMSSLNRRIRRNEPNWIQWWNTKRNQS